MIHTAHLCIQQSDYTTLLTNHFGLSLKPSHMQ